jgi:hypothetical protein
MVKRKKILKKREQQLGAEEAQGRRRLGVLL